MPTTTPYSVNDAELADALDEARERAGRAEDRLARIVCAHIAAAVRDALTTESAAFDATHLRLLRHPGEPLGADGTYWTAAGEQRRLEMLDLGPLVGWVQQLTDSTLNVWGPLCEEEDGLVGQAIGYRLDLAQAAHLPADVHTSTRVREIRARLAAGSHRPWSWDEFTWSHRGASLPAGDPDAVHTDFVVYDAGGPQVAEVSVSYGPGDTDTPAEDVAETRANVELITRAPEDLLYLLAYLDHLAGGADAEELHLRGYCAHCRRSLYSSTPTDELNAADGSTQCERRLPTGRTIPVLHALST
ncbi:hypothetical protein [Streptomyces silvensis]|uniref:Uncharacterized protein n=1 Tax=Streptomyces silvensis TaxID=1765722 RepID=A0A0W7XB33_9ACTN|nr:hypothetical protein [Streptomyces silvensis]KUF20150.1 hypothetical protein AT728_40225 [Streptomyces silvensis]